VHVDVDRPMLFDRRNESIDHENDDNVEVIDFLQTTIEQFIEKEERNMFELLDGAVGDLAIECDVS
jgi:hypothetical protein